MKLDKIASIETPSKVDLDVTARLAPTVQTHIAALQSLCKLLPNCGEIESKLHELEDEFKARLPPYTSMLEKNSDVTLEQQLHSPVHPAVSALEDELKKMHKENKKHHNGDVSSIVKKTADANKVSVNDLHKMFQSTHGNLTPHEYLRFAKDGSIHESSIDTLLESHHLLAMYETMKVGMGEKAWVAIAKRLRSQGIDPLIVEQMINHAIIKVSKTNSIKNV